MSKQLDWDAYRYVLEDPTLDRSDFEARMLDDVELALAVAGAVSDIDTLRAASFFVTPAEQSVTESRHEMGTSAGWRLTSLAVLAAGLLLAIGLMNYQINSWQTRSVSAPKSMRVGQQSLAESWLALQQTELVDVSSNLVDVSTNLDIARDEDAIVESDSAEDDWLMDAAREFYSQGGAS